jgi:hypothetical protein
MPAFMAEVDKERHVDNVEIPASCMVLAEAFEKAIQIGRKRKIHSSRKIAYMGAAFASAMMITANKMEGKA